MTKQIAQPTKLSKEAKAYIKQHILIMNLFFTKGEVIKLLDLSK